MGESSDEDSALKRIRQTTRQRHRALEARVEALGLFSSAQQFARHLRLLHHFCGDALGLLRNQPDLVALVSERYAELGLDLELLGQLPAPVTISVMPAYDRAQSLGLTYIVEGSRLGAASISARLRDSGVSTTGLRSLAAEPSQVRVRWGQLCEKLEQLSPDEWDVAAATAAEHFLVLVDAHERLEPITHGMHRSQTR